MPEPPRLPSEMLLRYTDVPEGRIRTRVLGTRRPGGPPVVVVQGMAVSDYLLPACAALGAWTEVHLFDVPGFAGSGRPTRRLDVRGYGEALAHWLAAAGLDRAVVVGHSSGTQVAAWAGVLAPDRVAGVALASPTIDPVARPWPKLLYRWRLDARSPSPGLEENHVPEWKRAGVTGALHLVRVHLADRIEEQVARLDVPLLVIRAEDDRLTTDRWVRALAASAGGELVTVPGAHAFLWLDPEAWSAPLRGLAARAG
ncbi:alpha/beta fold hydrolase [Geodermatophilus marinus]|uniref:alpha/beta fold hydrolase n=1 Tax=Geodermatophilus sp. LHW52908 TaxID=2303986 RepID=UPI000E3E954E|nr:alpha/beta hydrolase [Geodermatophilus sp. LHW52908]RFU20411.1 alpha/beta hydrolase [Geodermatophilus sp. LHW52908]